LVEHDDLAPVATFFADRALRDGETVDLGEGAAHHARVKRLAAGEVVFLTDGAGVRATASIVSLDKSKIACRIERTTTEARPPALHLRAPMGDRDRMLWLGEKATELGVTTWQGVRFRRSMSVSPRGEGSAFATKLRSRMIAALEQSGGAWLPSQLPDVDVEAVAASSDTRPIVLDQRGRQFLAVLDRAHGGATVLLGPEGGIEPSELAILEANGWQRARLASTTLRFETAGVAAIAVIRAAQLLNES
jgi:16S rRNA (uracil1498-N3)-methyltransferase